MVRAEAEPHPFRACAVDGIRGVDERDAFARLREREAVGAARDLGPVDQPLVMRHVDSVCVRRSARGRREGAGDRQREDEPDPQDPFEASERSVQRT